MHSQTVCPRRDGPRAAALQALAAADHQIWAASARSHSVYLTVCPFSLDAKAEQIRLRARRQHHHPTIIPPLTWLPSYDGPSNSGVQCESAEMGKECHVSHWFARCSC